MELGHAITGKENAIDVLRRLIDAPGVLAATDYMSGARYSRLTPCDPVAFVRAHILGPGKLRRPPTFSVREADAVRTVASFVRSEVLPVAEDGRCTHVSASFRTRNSSDPGDGLLAAAMLLREDVHTVYLERSVLNGVWILWAVFGAPVSRNEAEMTAKVFRQVIHQVGDKQVPWALPLQEATGYGPIYLPCPFYSSGFLGLLHVVDDHGNLLPLPHGFTPLPEPVDHSSQVDDADIDSARSADGVLELEQLLDAWCSQHGSRAARAGEIVSAMKTSGLLPRRYSEASPQMSAIDLGRELIQYSRNADGNFRIEITPSGHSRRFSITRKEG